MKIKFLSLLTTIVLGAFCMVSCSGDDDSSGKNDNGSGSKLNPTDEYYWLDTSFCLNDGKDIYYPNGSHRYFLYDYFVGIPSEVTKLKNTYWDNEKIDYQFSWYSEVCPSSTTFDAEKYEAEWWYFGITCSSNLTAGMSLENKNLYVEKYSEMSPAINSHFKMISGTATITDVVNNWVIMKLDNVIFADAEKKTTKKYTLTGKMCFKMK